MMKRWVKRSFQVISIGLISWLVGSYIGSIISTHTRTVSIPMANIHFEEAVENIELKAKDEVAISAWYIPDTSLQKAVVLLNGLRGNRLGMVERAQFYRKQGFAVLLLDLRGTGGSEAALITFGWKERWDLQAGIQFLQNTGYQNIAVHGISLGAATIAFSLQDNPNYSFMVLESCYDNIDQALRNRVERFYLPEFLFDPLKFFTEWRLGIQTKALYPENYLHLATAPTLFLAGDSEIRVRKEETEYLYQKCGAQQKEIHFFKGAKHEDFLNRYGEEWSSILQQWLLKQKQLQTH